MDTPMQTGAERQTLVGAVQRLRDNANRLEVMVFGERPTSGKEAKLSAGNNVDRAVDSLQEIAFILEDCIRGLQGLGK